MYLVTVTAKVETSTQAEHLVSELEDTVNRNNADLEDSRYGLEEEE
jgi:hypothetical protein